MRAALARYRKGTEAAFLFSLWTFRSTSRQYENLGVRLRLRSCRISSGVVVAPQLLNWTHSGWKLVSPTFIGHCAKDFGCLFVGARCSRSFCGVASYPCSWDSVNWRAHVEKRTGKKAGTMSHPWRAILRQLGKDTVLVLKIVTRNGNKHALLI